MCVYLVDSSELNKCLVLSKWPFQRSCLVSFRSKSSFSNAAYRFIPEHQLIYLYIKNKNIISNKKLL